jgi:hypothetical protein
MFATLIQYRLNPIFKHDFFSFWKEQERILMESRSIISSTLHLENPISFVSYTLWDSRESFERHSLQTQGPVADLQLKMENACKDIRTLYKMEVIQNLPIHEQ